MRRRVFIAGLIAATAAGSIDLGACGDKFLRVGRSARFRRYAAVHPAAILIYSPRNATREGIDELKASVEASRPQRTRARTQRERLRCADGVPVMTWSLRTIWTPID